MLRNNLIAIIAISFTVVGSLWGVGNLLNPPEESNLEKIEGILMVARNNAFNDTNPTIFAQANVPTKVVILNKDFVRHDFIVDELNINTAYLSAEQDFITAIATGKVGKFNYYCSLHPNTMTGELIITE